MSELAAYSEGEGAAVMGGGVLLRVCVDRTRQNSQNFYPTTDLKLQIGADPLHICPTRCSAQMVFVSQDRICAHGVPEQGRR